MIERAFTDSDRTYGYRRVTAPARPVGRHGGSGAGQTTARPLDLGHPPELGSAIFEGIEGFSNPSRRHSALGYQSRADYETTHTTALTTAA